MVAPEDHLPLIIEIERVKGRQDTHELVCAERYKRLDERHASFEQSISNLSTDVRAVLERAEAKSWDFNWRAWAVAGLVFTILIGSLGWTLSQLYEHQPERAKAAIAAAK